MTHPCHAIACDIAVPPRMLMCAAHWKVVPDRIQKLVWREYREGQERDKRPSDRYLLVQAMAVAFVAREEGQHTDADVARFIEQRVRTSGIDHNVAIELIAAGRS